MVQYILLRYDTNDDRIKRVVASWRGVRPAMHYSCSREDLLSSHSATQRPDFAALTEQGFKKGKLRAHSDYMWNSAVNEWALSHWQWGDIMVEAKMKNLASGQLYSMTEESKQIAA